MSTKGSRRARIQKARVNLVAAIARYAAATGEAQRVNGYRSTKPNDDDLHKREMARWEYATKCNRGVDLALRAYTRALGKGL